MKEVELGRSGLKVSELCLGTMFFGIKVPEQESFRLLDFYYDRGGRFFDTANKYATWVPGFPEPVGEELLGRWMASRKHRGEIVVATKMGFPYGDVPRGLSKSLILQEVDKSLKKLRVDRIDLLYAHADDSGTPLEETMETFHSLIRAGKVKQIGSSNFSSWRMALADRIAQDNGWTPYCCTQARLSVLWSKVNADFGRQLPASPELIEYCREQSVTLLCYSPLLQGIFGREDRSFPQEYDTPQNREIFAMIREEAASQGISGNTVVLAWMRKQGFIPLITGSSLKQIEENLQAVDYVVSPGLDDRIKKIYYPHRE